MVVDATKLADPPSSTGDVDTIDEHPVDTPELPAEEIVATRRQAAKSKASTSKVDDDRDKRERKAHERNKLTAADRARIVASASQCTTDGPRSVTIGGRIHHGRPKLGSVTAKGGAVPKNVRMCIEQKLVAIALPEREGAGFKDLAVTLRAKANNVLNATEG